MQSGRTRNRIVQWYPGALAGRAESASADMRDLHLLPLGVSPDRRSRVSLYHQIYEGLRSAILEGRLESGVRLPSTRAAAAELGVARNTVVAVFEQLAAEGFLRSRVGDGTRVADIEPELLFRPARRISRQSGSALEPGTGSTAPSALSARGTGDCRCRPGCAGSPAGCIPTGTARPSGLSPPHLGAHPRPACTHAGARAARVSHCSRGAGSAFAHAVRNTGQTVPQPVQGALAEFIETGHYGRHVRRMRALHSKRQALLFTLVREHLPGVLELVPCEAGM